LPIIDIAIRFLVSLLPVVLFLVVLVYLDTYKLVRPKRIVLATLAGCAAAGVSLVINTSLMDVTAIEPLKFRAFVVPLIEEIAKGSYVVWLLSRRQIGFMVDAAVVGFAVGTGFAIIENTHYIGALGDRGMHVWVVRGFGTAIMHGGITAILGIISKNLFDRGKGSNPLVYLPGLAVAYAIHSSYNQFIISPIVSTIIIHTTLPPILLGIFYQSERSTRNWLGSKMDVETELLAMIKSGRISDTRIGHYFQEAREHLPPEMVVDMLCYLRIHVELAIAAKGILMMREAGFEGKPPADTEEKLLELKSLEKQIGRAGHLAISPFLHTSTRDLWQIYMLSSTKKRG